MVRLFMTEKALTQSRRPAQSQIFDILVAFHNGKVAIVRDISQMCYQLVLTPEERTFHRFLWRDCIRSDERTPGVQVSKNYFWRLLFLRTVNMTDAHRNPHA